MGKKGALLASNPAPSHERAWYTLFMQALDFLDFHTFREKSMIGQWVRMHFYDKNSVYQALLWIRPGYEARGVM